MYHSVITRSPRPTKIQVKRVIAEYV